MSNAVFFGVISRIEFFIFSFNICLSLDQKKSPLKREPANEVMTAATRSNMNMNIAAMNGQNPHTPTTIHSIRISKMPKNEKR